MITKKNPLKSKHSQNNRESLEGTVLRFIREARKLSLLDVATVLNVKAAEIDHFENGRKFYTPDDLEKFLKLYDFSSEHFKQLLLMKKLNKQMVNYFFIQNGL